MHNCIFRWPKKDIAFLFSYFWQQTGRQRYVNITIKFRRPVYPVNYAIAKSTEFISVMIVLTWYWYELSDVFSVWRFTKEGFRDCFIDASIYHPNVWGSWRAIVVREVVGIIFFFYIYRLFTVISETCKDNTRLTGYIHKWAWLHHFLQDRMSATPAGILYKSTAGHYRPVSCPYGPITARCRFINGRNDSG